MPILAAAGQPVVITPPPVGEAVGPVWAEDAGTMTATWIDPTGVEWPLSTTDEEIAGWFTMNGPAGWGAAPIEIVADPLPRGGEQPRFIRSKPRRMQWPVYIGGHDYMRYTTRRRKITRAFTMTTPRAAPGWLKVALPDGTARWIAAYYEQGLEGEAGQDHLFSRNLVQLYCPDGYWWDTETKRLERAFTGAGEPFLDPFITVASSRVASGGPGDPVITVDNRGDVTAWPVWTLTGPMTRFEAFNYTVGGRFAFTYNLLAGQVVTITTNRPSVRGPGDVNLSKHVDWFNPEGTELWPLVDGRNDIRFLAEGTGAGAGVKFAWIPRYETH